jgi:hypothetical protein
MRSPLNASGTTVSRVAVDHLGGSVGEEPPLAEPLGLERGGDDEQPPADAARVPEGVAGGDRLGRLPETHVVGEEEASAREEALDSLALVGVETLLEGPEGLREPVQVPGAPKRPRDSPTVLQEQRPERGLAVSISEQPE